MPRSGVKLERQQAGLIVPALDRVAPGSELRQGLDDIVSGRTGGLITIGDTEHVLRIANGGFHIDAPFSAQRLSELAKMDGAIILDDAASRILYCNVHLSPDPALPTIETGTRHRTAERVARQTHAMVLSVSARRDVVTLYLRDIRWALEDVRVVLSKANQAIQTLQKYRNRLDQIAAQLTTLEFEDVVTVDDVVQMCQRAQMVKRVGSEIERYLVELGSEGRLIRLQLEELLSGVEEQRVMVTRDYCTDQATCRLARTALSELDSEELLDPLVVAHALGFEGTIAVLDKPVHPRGYRLLRRIPRVPAAVVEKLVGEFGRLDAILSAKPDQLDKVEGVGSRRAEAIQQGLRRLREHSLLERIST
jgi:diadenylate cyclase